VKQVAASFSNEFNNIFALILGNTKLAWADLAEGGPLPETLIEVEKSVRRGSALARRLTALGWQRDGQFSELHLSEVVQNSLPLIRATLSSNITLEAKLDFEAPAVWADVVQVEQMILNLSANAVDSMKEKGGTLVLQVETILPPDESPNGLGAGEYVQLSIRDTGSGMDATTVKQVFNPFFTTKAGGVGSGLGLYVVQEIVAKHGAGITVESAVGEGTIVRVCMTALGSQAPKVRVEYVGTAPEPGGRAQRILYVDDDEAMVFLVDRILNRLGYEVTVFSNPRKALEVFHCEPAAFDAVVSDLSMPSFSGIRLAEELLRIRPDLPILISTGCILPEDAIAVRNLGLPDLVLKPDAVEDFGGLIDNLLKQGLRPT
jgi:two-component system, cell cycle sensor histidine kinase and response regulator CckA